MNNFHFVQGAPKYGDRAFKLSWFQKNTSEITFFLFSTHVHTIWFFSFPLSLVVAVSASLDVGREVDFVRQLCDVHFEAVLHLVQDLGEKELDTWLKRKTKFHVRKQQQKKAAYA